MTYFSSTAVRIASSEVTAVAVMRWACRPRQRHGDTGPTVRLPAATAAHHQAMQLEAGDDPLAPPVPALPVVLRAADISNSEPEGQSCRVQVDGPVAPTPSCNTETLPQMAQTQLAAVLGSGEQSVTLPPIAG